VASWSFPTCHARALPCIARDPGARLRDVAVNLGIPNAAPTASSPTWPQPATPSRRKDGHRNRYQIQAHLPLPEPASQEPAIGDVLALLPGAGARLQLTGTGPACGRRSPDSYTLGLLTRQDGHCPLCGDHLLAADQPPQSPREWERWWLQVTRKAIAASYLVHHGRPGPAGRGTTRLVHATCHRGLQARQRGNPAQLTCTPSRLA
jgi:hypothetical protein